MLLLFIIYFSGGKYLLTLVKRSRMPVKDEFLFWGGYLWEEIERKR